MVGNTLGKPGTLPPVFILVKAFIKRLRVDLSERKQRPLRKGEIVKVQIGHSLRRAKITAVENHLATESAELKMRLELPICAPLDSRIAVLTRDGQSTSSSAATSSASFKIAGFGVLQKVVLAKAKQVSKTLTGAGELEHGVEEAESNEGTNIHVSINTAVAELPSSPSEFECNNGNDVKTELQVPGRERERDDQENPPNDTSPVEPSSIALVGMKEWRMYSEEYPRATTLTVARFLREVPGAGTYVTLPEYGELEALVPLGQHSFAGRRARHGKTFPKNSDVVVKVLRSGPHGVDVTRKRIDTRDKEDCLQRFKRSSRLRSLIGEFYVKALAMYAHKGVGGGINSDLEERLATKSMGFMHRMYDFIEENEDCRFNAAESEDDDKDGVDIDHPLQVLIQHENERDNDSNKGREESHDSKSASTFVQMLKSSGMNAKEQAIFSEIAAKRLHSYRKKATRAVAEVMCFFGPGVIAVKKALVCYYMLYMYIYVHICMHACVRICVQFHVMIIHCTFSYVLATLCRKCADYPREWR
mmetsp:Transcript_27464/g.46222  ORF Transcript_27464/g.46222 Transcript_27464/m.46222 type:complete len:532 (+) Transcript_27464:568-2163(+)